MRTLYIGLIGLAVMVRNLVLNMSDHGFSAAVYNRTVKKMNAFLEGRVQEQEIAGAESLEEFAALLKNPVRSCS